MEEEHNIPPAFPHLKAISTRLVWGMHLNLFSGGGTRLTARTYKAYMGYLFTLLVFLLLSVGVLAGGFLWLGLHQDYTWATTVGSIFFLPFFLGVMVLLQNAFRAFIYRLHDLGLNGWWFAGISIFMFVLDIIASAGLKLNVGIFSAVFTAAPYFLVAAPMKNKYGFPVEYRWYSFPWYVRYGGEVMLWISVLTVMWAIVALFL